MGLAPSSYALYPVIAGYVAGEDETRSPARGFVLSLAFVLGTATVDAALGALFGFLGGVVIETVARYVVLWNVVVAALLIAFGLALLRLFRVKWPVLRMTWKRAHSVPGAYALGGRLHPNDARLPEAVRGHEEPGAECRREGGADLLLRVLRCDGALLRAGPGSDLSTMEGSGGAPGPSRPPRERSRRWRRRRSRSRGCTATAARAA
jgi:hypothetical protein